MGKSLLVLVVAVLFVIGLTAVKVFADPGEKGIFEAPQVVDMGAEVGGSEGKIERNGDYKVEIDPAFAASTTFDICIFDINLGTVFLQQAASDADGELKVTSDLGADNPGFFPTGTLTLQAPSLQVRDATGAVAGVCTAMVCTAGNVGGACPGGTNAECDLAGDCTGTLRHESGMDVMIP